MKVDFSPLATIAPPNPSKWDIIPVHSSDRASFKFCRRQWKWSSPNQLNLIPRASVFGVDKNLWFGTGIHYALEQYYHPNVQEDPAVAFATWFDLQWRGGIVAESEVKQFADRSPVLQPLMTEDFPQVIDNGDVIRNHHYKVDGLVDIIPDSRLDENLFLGLKDLGINMMKFYKDYAEANDNFHVISVEHDFSVPVINEKGEPLYMIDQRVMPDGWEPDFGKGNEFGPLMRHSGPSTSSSTIRALESRGVRMSAYDSVLEKQVHVKGRQDLLIQEQEYGRYGILDHKTASRIGDDYFKHLELDEQCTSYLAFGELEARIHDLPYKNLEFITYQALLKAYPKPPTPLKNGMPSISRTDETTTAEMFAAYIKANGLEPVFNIDVKLQNYYTWLLEQGDKRFIDREDTWRNHAQRSNAMIRLYYEARDMLSNPVAYPNPSKNYGCVNCRFRGPCIQAETGDDFMATLEDGYMPNWDR